MGLEKSFYRLWGLALRGKNHILFEIEGENDLSGHIESVSEFDKQFSKIENEYFNYEFFQTKKIIHIPFQK